MRPCQEDTISALEETIHLLNREGDLDSSGTFTLDLLSARHKFSKFLASNHHSYLLRLGRAAVQCRGSYLHCQQSRGQIVVHTDGLLCAFSELPKVIDLVVQSHPLAQALLLALELEPSLVEITLSNEERSSRLKVEPQGARLEALGPSKLRGTHVRFKFPGSALGPDLFLTRPELRLFKERFSYAPIPVMIGDRLLQIDGSSVRSPRTLQLAMDDQIVTLQRSWGLSDHFWNAHQPLQLRHRAASGKAHFGIVPQTRATVVLQDGPPDPGGKLFSCNALISLFCGQKRGNKVHFVHSGELIQSATHPLQPSFCEAVLECSHLQLDITGEKLVLNEPYRILLDWLTRRSQALTGFLKARYPTATHGDYRAQLLYDRRIRGVHTFSGAEAEPFPARRVCSSRR